ncbi:hypothetical protein ONZ45_g8536 [Pleurotus djamor]|nr:hypothetical protein ONZ45_g8536 [Pleurotus djamor]
MRTAATTPLPVELFVKIIEQHALPYRNNLIPLLIVSRTFYEILIPTIYESIRIDDDAQHYRAHQSEAQSSTYISCDRVHRLHSSVEKNRLLASYIKSLVQITLDADPINHLYHILPHLLNLKRLHLESGLDRDIQSIPSSVQLTHFSCSDTQWYTPSTFQSFLHSQRSSLRFLSVESERLQNMEDLLPPSLENLSTFKSAFPDSWDKIAKIAPIKHLSARAFELPWVRDPQCVFSNLVSLRLSQVYERDVIDQLGPYLCSLRWLHLSCLEDVNDINEQFDIANFMNISSADMTYIHFTRNKFGSEPAYNPEELRSLFEKYPLLVAVDICYQLERYMTDTPTTRYSRAGGGITCKEVSVPPPRTFDVWCELLREELDLDGCE